MAAASSRERARTVGLALLGLLFFATASTPVVQSIVQPPRCTAGPMLNAVLATLGVFLLLAARNPSAHRSLILFAGWSSFAHAAIMLVMSFQVPAQRGVLLASVALVGLGGVHHSFVVAHEDYAQALEHLRQSGVEITFEEDRQGGVINGPRAYFHDPDGTVLEFIDLTSYAGTH